MRILLTGATGYLGGKVAERLREMNYELGCVVRSNALAGKSRCSLPDAALLCDDENLRQSIRQFSPSCVIHMAGVYGRGQSDMELVGSNLLFPLRILTAARDAGIDRWKDMEKREPHEAKFHRIERFLNRILPTPVFRVFYRLAYKLYWGTVLKIRPNN